MAREAREEVGGKEAKSFMCVLLVLCKQPGSARDHNAKAYAQRVWPRETTRYIV